MKTTKQLVKLAAEIQIAHQLKLVLAISLGHIVFIYDYNIRNTYLSYLSFNDFNYRSFLHNNNFLYFFNK